jgi:hypothetical protein
MVIRIIRSRRRLILPEAAPRRHRPGGSLLFSFASACMEDTLFFMATSPKPQTTKRKTIAEEREEFVQTLEAVNNERERLTEAFNSALAMLKQEDIGWAESSSLTISYTGLDIGEIKTWSDNIRASLTGTGKNAPNPHMRNGLMLRHSFIWSGGIHYTSIPGSKETPTTQGKANIQSIIDDGMNKRLVFGSTARKNREQALFSDGLYLLVGEDNNKKNIRPVPLSSITETHRHPLYQDEIIAYRWTRDEAVRLASTKSRNGTVQLGQLTGERELVSQWVYVDWYEGEKAKIIIYAGKQEKVLKGFTAFDLHANRPNGQAFGSPDAISALVWARVIRDLIMNGVKMQDALAMFAFKVSPPTKAGQLGAAVELGKDHEAGSTAVGNDLTPMNSAGKGYDFGSIGFIVATMAASLHVSGIALSANTALAGSSYGAAKTLDLPGRMAMQTRRAEHIEFDERLLNWLGARSATAYFDNYDDATDEYRSVQAAMLAWTTGTLSAEAFRGELEIIYGRKLMGEIPEGVIIPNNEKQIQDAAAAAVAKASKVAPAPDQGQSNGAGEADHASDLPA